MNLRPIYGGNSDPAAPLLLVLHGEAMTGAGMQKWSGLDAVASALGWRACYPQAPFRTWRYKRWQEEQAALNALGRVGAWVGFSEGAYFVNAAGGDVRVSYAGTTHPTDQLQPSGRVLLIGGAKDQLVTPSMVDAAATAYTAAGWLVARLTAGQGDPPAGWPLFLSKRGHFYDTAANATIQAFLE
jgi:hypothetical protein